MIITSYRCEECEDTDIEMVGTINYHCRNCGHIGGEPVKLEFDDEETLA